MVDYVFYRDIYKGSIIADETLFEQLANKAYLLAMQASFGRIEDVKNLELLELINRTLCEVVEVLNSESEGSSSRVKSESQGKQSVTYFDINSPQYYKQLAYDVIYTNLARTGLLYRGV